jgi:hypothetical protein
VTNVGNRIAEESGESPAPDFNALLRTSVWNSQVTAENLSLDQDRYIHLILEQYKLYVEMADRISARRALANSFFITVNLAVVGLLGHAIEKGIDANHVWLLALITVTLVGQCSVWLSLLRSYRILNKAKYSIVGVLEEKLPALVYSRAEWLFSVRDNKYGRYFGLSRVEQVMPLLFSCTYIAMFAALVF